MRVDVAIIGAGTAGAAAAATLAPRASVVLLDRVAPPVWRIGETLPGAARRVLTTLGAWQRFEAAGHGAAPLKVSRWGSDEAVELDAFRDPDGAGWRIDRARFEADLRAGAVARGAILMAPVSVSGLYRGAQGWTVRLEGGDMIMARQIIDAGGRRSQLLRPFGQRRMVMDRLACVYQRLRQRGEADPATYTQSTPEGWWYTALLPDGWRVIGFHGDSDQPVIRALMREGPIAAARRTAGLAQALGELDDGSVSKPQVCAANSAAASSAGQGWLAAGDSAIALDPLSSQGLFNALVTGMEAGESALALLDGDETAMPAHAARTGRIWQAYAGHHATYYGMERRWPDAPFWQRRLGASRAPVALVD
ncbi:tryptophan 7-halogenase [Hoeflea ulvae]|uniref:Tryptophan 7-halogenase n=1 Tax=Hoeflea ulvae TaxID=2983764 RepID=A0ABT3YIL3_9HYPH|nr:tryptophan 7-halogenase [Hoeflea ulvae]MCY0095743.1 tryptophan 7-halogenase [Hoeflea ulvae]